MKRPLIVFDTECATLFGPPHLVELGAVRVVDGEAEDTFDRLIRPQVPIEPEAALVHGITDEDVRDADDAATVLQAFADWVAGDWLAAHNARADAHVLAFEYARCGLEPPGGLVLDSLALARKVLTGNHDHKLDTLVEVLEIEGETRHRALPDAVACWQVIEACVEKLGGWDDLGEAELLNLAGSNQTIRTATPPRPSRFRSAVQALERAQREGVTVTLTYGDERENLARLDVVPHMIYQQKNRGYLEGECVRSGELKTYRLDRVKRVELIR